jgi:hypothetical protein
VRAAEPALKWLYFSYLEPLQFASKKRRRLAIFGRDGTAALERGGIDLEPAAIGCVPACSEIVEAHRRYLAKYLFEEQDARPSASRWRGVPLLIDLDRYADFQHYADRLKLKSKGALVRDIRKARRLGFYSKRFDRAHHRLDLFDIESSKRFRSGGPVLAAFLGRDPPPSGRPAIAPEPPLSPCPRHWYSDWGVFTREDGDAPERLVGYLYLKRIGNVVRVTALMGHGAYLARGVMKMLFADAMEWLLDRRDPRVAGIRYLHGGAIEHGNLGFLNWKRRFQFEPFIFRWQEPATPAPG